jgi:hypothetical protein
MVSSSQETTMLKAPEPNELGPGFSPSNIVALAEVRGRYGNDQVWACVGEFKNVKYFNIRQVYKDQSGLWLPGKGLSWDIREKPAIDQILEGLGTIRCP